MALTRRALIAGGLLGWAAVVTRARRGTAAGRPPVTVHKSPT